MSAWKGKEAKYALDRLPHMTKIARKPERKGTELKAIADGESGVLLRLEVVEGTVRQRQKQYCSQFGEGASIVLRLAEPYKGTRRTIIADSTFASVKTLVQVEKPLGLFFMGIVKTATVQYPKTHMQQWSASPPCRFQRTTE
ncbi:Transposase IS4 [Phytophthora infestans]|uniref:Transposase IS4 n=1 Tax=Phytophthora infestans TaxID=4787 RepID=A0A8S9V9L8_PHYIN|nr:Transposase IS4 [Phytophthora infestans]